MIEVAGGCSLPGLGQRSCLARCPLSPPLWPHLAGSPGALRIVRGRPSPSHQGRHFQVPAQCGPPQARGRGGGGQGPHWAPQSPRLWGPAELEHLGQEGGLQPPPPHCSSEGRLSMASGWPIKPARCPINRQQPCAAAQLQCPPHASPPPTPGAAALETSACSSWAAHHRRLRTPQASWREATGPQRHPASGGPHWL